MRRFEEHLEEEGVRVVFDADAVLYDGRSEYQHLTIFRNRFFGHVLMLDGAVQTTTRDEFIYHEMMAHVPILAHGSVGTILIIGGGDGALAREVLRHGSVRSVVQIEIDPVVVEASFAHLNELNAAAFTDPRLRVVVSDGAEYVRTASESFDIILVDSSDPWGPADRLFTQEFYENARARLAPGGILVAQSGIPFLQADTFTGTMAHFARSFVTAACYLTPIPSYLGGPIAFAWGTDADLSGLTLDLLASRYAGAALTSRYYTPAVHQAAFALPQFISELVKQAFAEVGRPCPL
jgi:spermidine synthase